MPRLGNQGRPSGLLAKPYHRITVNHGASVSSSSYHATSSAATAVLRPEDLVVPKEESEERSCDELETSSDSFSESEEYSDEEEQQKERKMPRFSAVGDVDGNQERPCGPSPKRLRLSNPMRRTARMTVNHDASIMTVNHDASIFCSNHRATSSAATAVQRPEDPVVPQGESEERTSDESETSSDSFSESEEYSDEEEHQNEVISTETRVNYAPNGNVRESEGPSGVTVTLTDTDVLDCPICCEPLCSPVYQCENGHISCASCCTTMKNKCGSCGWRIGYNRCRAMEKVLDSTRTYCRNLSYGCPETLIYSKKQAHEKTCNHVPCSCPFTGCDYVAESKHVYSHFALNHSLSSKKFFFNAVIPITLDNTQTVIFLQDFGHTTLFILNRRVETIGSFVNVVCVGPTSEKRRFLYELKAIGGESSIALKTFVDCVPKWTGESPKGMSLLVPCDFVSKNKQLKLYLVIRRNNSVVG